VAAAFRSSGDLAADRRFDYARAYAGAKDHDAAADLFRQALELAPDWLPALQGLATALVEAGRRDEAIPVLERMLALDPADENGAGLRLAALGAAAVPAAPPAAFVRGLFDSFADRFDRTLLDGLGYVVPDRLAALVDRLRPSGSLGRVIDLGCGTGLMGARLRPRADRLEGVDLSAEMVAKARARGIYDALAVADLVDHLRAGTQSADLITAADVLVYVGDLGPVLAAAAARLAPAGLVVLSLETHDGDGFTLRDSLRYAHGDAHLAAAAARAGLAVRTVAAADLRMDRGAPVRGRLVALGRADEPSDRAST
jgi:predicted TPR repeat methyltransferase